MDESPTRVYVMLGDGEMAEGQVWEAAAFAGHYKLENLTVLADVNALGQSEPTMYQHNMEIYRQKFESEDWAVEVIDGHDAPLCSLRWIAPKRRKTARKRSWRGRSKDTEQVSSQARNTGTASQFRKISLPRQLKKSAGRSMCLLILGSLTQERHGRNHPTSLPQRHLSTIRQSSWRLARRMGSH
jgi:hypothetical protein